MASTDIDVIINKLEEIQKVFGGAAEIQLEEMNRDEFTTIKYNVAETINLVAKKQEERDALFNKEGRGVPVIRLATEIQDYFMELELQLGQMKDALRRQKKKDKKIPAEQMEVREKQMQKYKDLVAQLKAREDGETVEIDKKGVTLTDLKANLLGPKQLNREAVRRELNDIESEALQRFKKNDEEIDIMLDRANDGLDALKRKAEMMGETLDKHEKDLQELDRQVDKAAEGVKTANARLKQVLLTYRRPSKFCLDVCLILSLLGLVAVIIKLATSKSS